MRIIQLDENLAKLRVAIVHYWFLTRTGGERVVEALAELFPQADLFSLFVNRASLAPVLKDRQLITSFLQKIPGAARFHRHFLLLQPFALEQFDLSDYDLVISSESGPAKGVITSSKSCHICYCHSPMRYIWDMHAEYQRNMSSLIRPFFALTAHYMRMWDYASSGRVDHFVANSRFIASRIRKIYGRESTVIHAPVNVPYEDVSEEHEDHYLAVGRLVDYKRFDLAIETCKRSSRRLRIVGDGPQYRALKRLAGPTVEFLGAVSDPELYRQFAACRALLFPGEEDFGLVPVEAQSFGRPVIAYAAGGALETVVGIHSLEDFHARATGVFFSHQSVDSLLRAMSVFETCESGFSATQIQRHSKKFCVERFMTEFRDYVSQTWLQFKADPRASGFGQEAAELHFLRS